jgi:hypothetical protein
LPVLDWPGVPGVDPALIEVEMLTNGVLKFVPLGIVNVISVLAVALLRFPMIVEEPAMLTLTVVLHGPLALSIPAMRT